jgi:hypothetical protein
LFFKSREIKEAEWSDIVKFYGAQLATKVRKKMSVGFSGTLKRSGGVASAIAKQIRLLNLKPVKNIVVKFDPFNKNVTQTRYVISVMYFGTINFETISTRLVTSQQFWCAFVLLR